MYNLFDEEILNCPRQYNLFYAVPEIVEISKFPVTAYPKVLFFLFQTIIPIALMSSLPAMSLRGLLEPWQLIYAVILALIIFFSVRAFWFWSLKRYTGASS
jgi:ABC-2 type transport system permease protein